MKKPWLLLTLFFILLAHQPIRGQLIVNGDIQNFNAIQTFSDNELITARNRLNFRINRPLSIGDIHSETNIYNNYSDSFDIKFQLRELYLDIFRTNYDLRIGLQRLTTGRSDAGFVTDVYSGIDFREILTKEPDEIVFGTLAINMRRYFNRNSIQLIVSPFQNKSRLPNSNSRWFPIQDFDAPFEINLIKKNKYLSLSQLSGAFSFSNRSLPDLDFDLTFLYWNYPSPSLGIKLKNIDNLRNLELDLLETYNQSFMLGVSGQYKIAPSWFITSETLFVQNRQFTFLPVPPDQLENAFNDAFTAFQVLSQFPEREDNYLMGKPWIHTMTGLQTELYGITMSGQIYLEWMLNYDQKLLAKPLFPYATLLLSRSLNRDRLRLSSLNRLNFTGRDWLFQFQGAYELADGFEVSMGTNLMGGNKVEPFYGHFSFNQYRDNSFIFTRITFYY